MIFYRTYLRPVIYKFSADVAGLCQRHLSERSRVLLACVLTGMVCGVGAWVMKYLIRILSSSLTSRLTEGGFNWELLVCPLSGLVICGWMQRRLFRRDVSRGTDRLRRALRAGHYALPHQLAYQPILGCAVTVGLGGSAGAEGPIAYAGAAMGSNTARFFRLAPGMTRIMVGFGAAAGISAIFKAPLAGVFFVLEVLGMQLTAVPLLGLVACCLVGAFTACLLSGMTPGLVWANAVTDFDYSALWWLLPVGVFMGLYCRWYNGSGLYMSRRWMSVVTPLMRELGGGIFLGLLIFCMPALFGEGYVALQKMLAGDLHSVLDYSPLSGVSGQWAIVLMLAGILLVKGAAVYTTNYTGGVAGTFAPTLFAGCMAGTLSAMGLGALGCPLPPSQIAYVCMAGAMAGIVRAPLMATFITVVVTMTYSLLFPVAIVAFLSYAVVNLNLKRNLKS